MKKFYSKVALAALCSLSAFTFSSCSDDDGDKPAFNPDVPTSSSGVYFLTQGQYTSQLEGSLNFVSYADNKVENDLFQRANGRSLGNTPQCGLVYGSKMYLGVCFSNTIEILDKKDYSSIKQIRLSSTETGTQPRSMVTRNGYVYISMWDGYVARLDTLDLTIDKRVQVGANPEGIAIYNGRIFVPNSDGMNPNGPGNTASIIDLASFTKIKDIEVPVNPDSFVEAEGKLYMLARGNYYDIDAAVYEINAEATDPSDIAKEVMPATMMASDGKKLYLINAPWQKPIEYFVYNPQDDTFRVWEAPEVYSPNQIGVDPISGKIFITSYVQDGAYAGYSLPTYAAEYTPDLHFVKKYNLGVGQSAIFFDVK